MACFVIAQIIAITEINSTQKAMQSSDRLSFRLYLSVEYHVHAINDDI